MVEEVEAGGRPGAKERYLREVVSTAQPHLLDGLVDDETGAQLAAGALDGGAAATGGFLAARPIIGRRGDGRG